jgi:hypothetical protein
MALEHLTIRAGALLRLPTFAPLRCISPFIPLAGLFAAANLPAAAAEFKASGRLSVGLVVRTEARDPALLVAVNGAALGEPALAPAGQNSDDANNNYGPGDTVSRAVKGYLDLSASAGSASALVRIKGWYDDGLLHDGRPWGNAPNGYVAGAPLSDAGAARSGRFSGVAVGELWVQDTAALGPWRLLGKLGRQSLNWGERANTGSGLSVVNVLDTPALRRAGATPQEFRAPQPMLFARLSRQGSGLGVEGFWQSSFKPGALDTCGTFWATTDYLADGCERTFAGPPPASDRQRLRSGAYLKRVPSPYAQDGPQYGLALTWKSPGGTEFGLYRARYINRTPTPGVRKSTRSGGPALVPGDPDGRNLAYFVGHVGGIDMLALTALRQRPGTLWYAELTWRPNQPVQLPPSDVLVAFVNPTAPALLRRDADALGPGGYFHAYDRYRTAQLQVSVQQDLPRVGKAALTGTVDVVYKRAMGLPDPAVRRYGRADVFGTGPVFGVCSGTGPLAATQCSLDGYVTPGAWAYRLKLEARWAKVLPALDLGGDITFGHEVRGWSYDLQLNEGRKTANFALRAEYGGRYLFQLAYAPIWGGRYNQLADRDQASFMAGIKF